MDLKKILEQLRLERDELDAAIADFEMPESAQSKPAPNADGSDTGFVQ